MSLITNFIFHYEHKLIVFNSKLINCYYDAKLSSIKKFIRCINLTKSYDPSTCANKDVHMLIMESVAQLHLSPFGHRIIPHTKKEINKIETNTLVCIETCLCLDT